MSASEFKAGVINWAKIEARKAVASLKEQIAAQPFDLAQAHSHCLHLVAAGAAALALSTDEDELFEPETGLHYFHCTLFDRTRDDPDGCAEGYAAALMGYIHYTRVGLRIRMPADFMDCIEQILERSVDAYLKADPDLNWDIAYQYCERLFEAVDAVVHPADIEDIIDEMAAEIASVPLLTETMAIDYEAINRRHAPIDRSTFQSGHVDTFPDFDSSPRFYRLAKRYDDMIAGGIPDAEEYRRVRAALSEVAADPHADPEGRYGHRPWEKDVAASRGF